MTRKIFGAVFMTALILWAGVFQAALLEAEDRIEKPVKEAVDIRRENQKKEEAWRQEREKMLALLEKLRSEKKRLENRKDELNQVVQAAQKRLADKNEQLSDIENISNRIRPFLEELLEKLRNRINTDLAFLQEERHQRIASLESLLADPEAAASEKYRKVMEALLIEAEYGFTTEVYQETISVEDKKRLVNIFRLGRMSLFFLTLDREQCGFYNIAEQQWQTLSNLYLPDIQAAVDIATKRRTAEMLNLPLGRIVTQ